jgi:serpin B
LREVEVRETLEDWTSVLRERTVSVRIPKVRFRAEVDDLAEVLAALGMPQAFDASGADLSGIAPGLWIGSIAHRAFLTIDERGTEAAAVTAIRTRGADSFDVDEAEWFVATHPFLLAIRHRETGVVLFLGRVADPSVVG